MVETKETRDDCASYAYLGLVDGHVPLNQSTTPFSSPQPVPLYEGRALALNDYFYLLMTLAERLRLALGGEEENGAPDESEGSASNQDSVKVGDHVFKLMCEAQNGDFLRKRRETEKSEFTSKIPKPPKTHLRFVLESKYSEMNTGRGL